MRLESHAGERRPIRALLVSPTRLIGDGLCALASQRDDVVIAGQAATVAEAVRMRSWRDADVMLVDAALGPGALRSLLADAPDGAPPAFVINAGEDASAIVEYIEAGARGYATASEPLPGIVSGLRALERRETVCAPGVMASVCRRLAGRSRCADASETPQAPLTGRERQIVALMARGLIDKEIAQRLGIRVGTVKKHAHHLFAKLDVHRRRDAVRSAVREGLLAPELRVTGGDPHGPRG